MQKKIKTLEALCTAYLEAHPEAEKTKIQLLYISRYGHKEGNDEHASLSYYAGQPPYIEEWPYMEETPMQHLVTFDLRALPQLNKEFVTIMMADPYDNEAYEPYNADTFLYYHSGQAQDEKQEAPIEPLGSKRTISMHPIEVPLEAFASEEDEDWQGPLSKELAKIKKKLINSSYLGGRPIWIQEDQGEDNFIGQFDSSIAYELNLGDSGIMYVFEYTAFWQCY